MRGWVLGGLVVMVVLLQQSFLGVMSFPQVAPNLFLILMAYAALGLDWREAIVMGLGGGLMLDLTSGVDFGLRMAFFSSLVMFGALLRRVATPELNIQLALSLIVAGTLLFNAAILGELIVAGAHVTWVAVWQRVGLELVLNLIGGVVAWRPLVGLFSVMARKGGLAGQRQV